MRRALVATFLLFFTLVVALLPEAGSSHRRASNFLVRDKKVTKEARLPTAYPAELTARLQRYVQTAAGNMKDFHDGGARRFRARVVVKEFGFSTISLISKEKRGGYAN